MSSFLKAKQTKFTAYAVVYTAVVLGALGLLNFLANRHNQSLDLTANKRFTLRSVLKVAGGETPLCVDLGLHFTARFIELATDVNGHMPEHVVTKIGDILNEERTAVNGARVLLLGVAYKADVSDMRESPALDVLRLLDAKGADLRYHDPHVSEVLLEDRNWKSVELTDEELDAADLVVVLTDHTGID